MVTAMVHVIRGSEPDLGIIVVIPVPVMVHVGEWSLGQWIVIRVIRGSEPDLGVSNLILGVLVYDDGETQQCFMMLMSCLR